MSSFSPVASETYEAPLVDETMMRRMITMMPTNPYTVDRCGLNARDTVFYNSLVIRARVGALLSYIQLGSVLISFLFTSLKLSPLLLNKDYSHNCPQGFGWGKNQILFLCPFRVIDN